MKHRTVLAAALLTALPNMAAVPVSAADDAPNFLAAAMCRPPYTFGEATRLYEAAGKLAKPDMSRLGAAIYHLPAPIERDGFEAQDVIFAGSSVGVLLDGEVAAQVAERYRLAPEESHLFGASTRGFSRVLPDREQPMADMGLVSVVAREGPAMAGKTLLACEFVSHEDRQALQAYEQQRR